MNDFGLEKLKNYIEEQDYRGYDPYDGLSSPIFKLPVIGRNKTFRFYFQQFLKRFPINLRPLLLVPKGTNPVTLGLAIQAYAYLYLVEGDKKSENKKKIGELINELKQVIPKGYSGACWGYDFDWEARNATIPAYEPTVVATSIITNALYLVYKFTGITEARDLVISSSFFVMKDLNRTYHGKNFCFSYSPHDTQQVFNASIKGARILAQAYAFTGDQELKQTAKKAVDFVMDQQQKDGSWGYSLTKRGSWTDNYHTGYILDCASEYQEITKDDEYRVFIERGYDYYIKNFITPIGQPKFYNHQLFPIDCTAAGQTILTTIRYGDIEKAKKVAEWMSLNMQKKSGGYKFREFKSYAISTSFMRWSDAWMFAALSNLKYVNK